MLLEAFLNVQFILPKKNLDSTTIPKFVVLSIWICCVLIAFDFKGQESGGLFQITSFSLICAILGCCAYAVSTAPKKYSSRKLQLILIVISFYLITTFFTAAVQNVPMSNYLVVVSPYVVMLLSYWLTMSMVRRYGIVTTASTVLPALIAATVLSTVWTFFYGFSQPDSDLGSVRYRIVSVLLPFALAYLMSAAASKSLTKANKIFAVFVLGILLISQTRSYILVIILSLLLSTYGHSRSLSSWAKQLKKITVISFVIIMFSLLLIQLFELALPSTGGPGLFEMWTNRLFGSNDQFGFDLTTATRLAEYSDQMDKLFSSPLNMFIGNGLGSPYTYSGKYADLISSVLGNNAIPEGYWNGGHSIWVYTLYSGGFIFGLGFIFLLIYLSWVSLSNLKKAHRTKDLFVRRMLVISASGFLCILSTGFTAFPLGSRPAAFLMGILIALTIGFKYSRLRPPTLRHTVL